MSAVTYTPALPFGHHRGPRSGLDGVVEACAGVVHAATSRLLLPAVQLREATVAVSPDSLDEKLWSDGITHRVEELLELPSNWDGHGGQAVFEPAAEAMIELLFEIGGASIRPPSLYATPSGGVGAEWSTKADVEIVVEVDDESLNYEAAILTDDSEREFVLRATDDWDSLAAALANSYSQPASG